MRHGLVGEQALTEGEQSGAPAIGQEAERADADKAAEQDVEHAPSFLDRLRVKAPQSREPLCHSGCGQLSLAKQVRLVLANVFRSELIRRAPKVACKILDRLDVAVDG